MFTVTFTNSAVQAIATLHHSTPEGKNDRSITPILAAIQLELTPEGWTARATDRYTVGELTGQMGAHTLEAGESHEILLDSLSWVEIAKRIKADRGGLITLEHDGNQVTVTGTDGLIIAVYLEIKGNYPPLARLFPADDSQSFADIGQVAIDPRRLGRLDKIMTEHLLASSPDSRRHAPMSMRFTSSSPDNPKPGPIVLKRHKAADPESTFRALLQPNMLIN